MPEPRRSRLTEADRTDWANFVARIRPLRGRPALPAAKQSEQTPRERPHPSPVAWPLRAVPPPVAIGDHPGGIDTGTWQRFRTGKLRAARVLDLHGMTAQHAFHALASFLRTAHADKLRCVEVVTGRGTGTGGGVLRRELPLWLNLPEIRPLVLAATHPHAANPGSVRLLLRRKR